MARVLITACLLALGVAVGWAGVEAEAGGQQAKAESPPVVTLLTLITGTCQEIQRYAESVLGAGVIRSAAEVQRGGASPDYTLFLSAPGSGSALSSFSLFLNILTSLFALLLINNCT